jgi:E3 ubiquitin-protein ligase BRE1
MILTAWLEQPYFPGVLFKDTADLRRHLDGQAKDVCSRVETLLKRIASNRGQIEPNIAELESKVNNLLAAQKEYLVKLDRLNTEKEQLSEQLNTATLRYFKAEKKLDRAKSAQAQKLEQQALASATKAATPAGENGSESAETNGNSAELLMKLQEASAAETKRKEQLEAALADLKALQEENSGLKARRESLTDEDYIRTDVFKAFKGQNEELIKRVNHLEALNKQLKEEADKLQAERSSFRKELEAEAQAVAQELEGEIQQRDQDLARVRSARDEILADRDMRKASMDQEKVAAEHIKELIAAKDDRISVLESQLQRYKPSEDAEMTSPSEIDDISPEELKEKYRQLEKNFQAINQELPSIERAYKKSQALAQKKVMDFTALEERLSMAVAEKAKADQKYFAVRKDTDTRMQESRALRLQNSKSAEIIAQLKDAEAHHRTLVANLDKQLVDLKQVNAAVMAENKRIESSTVEAMRKADSLKAQIMELTSLVKSRDASAATARERYTTQEAEVEKLRVRLDHTKKDRDIWKTKALSNSTEEEEGLRVSTNVAPNIENPS